MIEHLLTLEEVSAFLNIHRATVYRMAQGGKIPAMKVGKVWRFQQEKINEWLTLNSNDHILPRQELVISEVH